MCNYGSQKEQIRRENPGVKLLGQHRTEKEVQGSLNNSIMMI